MPSAWVKHVQSVYAKIKGKGGSYRDAMVQAKKSWAKKKGTAAKSDAAPKKGRRKKKSVATADDEEPAEEDEKAPAPKKKRRRRKKKKAEGLKLLQNAPDPRPPAARGWGGGINVHHLDVETVIQPQYFPRLPRHGAAGSAPALHGTL